MENVDKYIEAPSVKEFFMYSQLVRKGGLWVCDDISKDFYDKNVDPPGKGMLQFFDEIQYPKTITQKLRNNNGIGIVWM